MLPLGRLGIALLTIYPREPAFHRLRHVRGASGVFLVFLGLAFLGFSKPAYREKTLCKLPLFFIVTNAAIAVAWIKYLSGMRAVAWEPSAKASAS